MSIPDAPCRIEGCSNTHQAGFGLCVAHYQRKRRGAALNAPVLAHRVDSELALREAALLYADADTQEQFDAAWKRLRAAARRIR